MRGGVGGVSRAVTLDTKLLPLKTVGVSETFREGAQNANPFRRWDVRRSAANQCRSSISMVFMSGQTPNTSNSIRSGQTKRGESNQAAPWSVSLETM